MPNVQLEDSFESLSQQEWDAYLGAGLFNSMFIDESVFGVSINGFPDSAHPLLAKMIFEHNNKVGALPITYSLCRHYFDKGIPDDPWYISPGKDGSGIQYMPLFEDEHWMRSYWFNYFSDTYYLKISSVWDSVIEILNHYYGLDYKVDFNLKFKIGKWLKDNVPGVYAIIEGVLNDPRHTDAQEYRNLAAHGTSPGTVTNTVTAKKDVWVDVPTSGEDGKTLFDAEGHLVMKRVKAKSVVSMRVGDYTNAATIMKNMEEYAVFSGESIQAILKEMLV